MATRILFLCTGNACRSQMAQGVVNHDFKGKVVAYSAGTAPKGLDPKAIQVMGEIGIDITAHTSDHISQYEGQPFDVVMTLCGDAHETCPVFFGGVKRLHMGFDDPPKTCGTEEQVLAAYRRVRDEIRHRVGAFLREHLEK